MEKALSVQGENVNDESPMFKRHYELRARDRSNSNSSTGSKVSSKGRIESPNAEGEGDGDALPNLSRSSSNVVKSSESKIRKGPILLRRTLSSLSMTGNSGNGSAANNAAHKDHIDEDSRDKLPSLRHTSSHHSFTNKQKSHNLLKKIQNPNQSQSHSHSHSHNHNHSHSHDHARTPSNNQSHANVPSRKQSFAEALFKKFANSASNAGFQENTHHNAADADSNAKHIHSVSSSANANKNNYGDDATAHSKSSIRNDSNIYADTNNNNGSNNKKNHDKKNSISSNRNGSHANDSSNGHENHRQDRSSHRFSTATDASTKRSADHQSAFLNDKNFASQMSLGSRRSSKDSVMTQHLIESVPHTLRRKVSTFVHGLSHELEGVGSYPDSHSPIKRTATSGDLIDRDRDLDSGPSTSASVANTRRNSHSAVVRNAVTDEPSNKNISNERSNLENSAIYPLDTNLENLSDITKLSEPDRKSDARHTGGSHDESLGNAKSQTPEWPSGDFARTKSSSCLKMEVAPEENLPSIKSQQWVAPESWDVESNIEKPRTRKNPHGDLNAARSRRHLTQASRSGSPHLNPGQLQDNAAFEAPSGISSSLHFNVATDSESMNTDRFSSGTATSSDTESLESESPYSPESRPSSDYNLGGGEGGITRERNVSRKKAGQAQVNSTNVSSIALGSDENSMGKEISADDEKHDKVEYELERYYKDFSDLDPKRHYTIRIFNIDDTFTTLSCTPTTTVRDIIPALKRKFNITSQGSYQLSLKVGKLSKILRPLAKPIIIERKLLLLNGYRKSDPLHIMGIEDLSFVFKFLFHPVAPSHLTTEQEQRLMRSDFIHVDLRGMDLTTPPIIFYQHTSEIESLDVSNNADIFLPLEFIETAIKLSSLRMVNIRASRFPSNITDVDKLISLELQRNFIRKVPNTIHKLKNLTILNLQCNELDKLPKGFALLQSLQLLDLSSNRFVHYPEVINSCTNLLQVNLSYNKIHTLPSSMNHLAKLAKMNLSHNKLTVIQNLSAMKNLRTLNLKHNRITTMRTGASNLQNLFLTDNRISDFDDSLPKLRTLEIQENPMTSISNKEFYPMNLTSLSLSKAKLASVPSALFVKLSCLEKLDLSENNLTQLPDEIALLNRLVYLSVARNKLESLPPEFPQLKSLKSLDLHSNNIRDFVDGMENIELTSLNISSNMFGNSILSAPFSQNISSKSGLAKSLMFFFAADNQFDDQMWPLFNCFTNLKVLNLSYNNFQDISNLKLENLIELYFSGNKLSTLPGEIVQKWKSLKTLMLNGNHLLSLPAELSQLRHLNVFDVGSNNLKYNISNYHYDWNWRDNKDLKYLNLSGNRRFEIKSSIIPEINADLSDLTVLPNLKVLGLMDVTLNTTKVPDENINFRMRTTGSMINGMRYGVADTLGQRDFVSSRDVTFERFGGKDDECLICLHDGKNQNGSYGHNISRLVRDIYDKILIRQLEKYGDDDSGIKKALRFSFLQLNKEVNTMLSSVDNGNDVANLTSADLLSGACSTAIYIKGNKMFTANIGDCMAILSKNNGDFQRLTKLHAPYKRVEYERIRISGGYVNDDKLDGVVDVSRAVGFFDLLPHIHASPDISLVTLSKADEMLIVATHKLWQYMDYETACDIAREHNSEPMLAAEAMKDHAIAYGCSENLTILCLSLFKNAEQQNRFNLNRNALITRRSTFEDATLRRLQPEISPPTGNLAIVFTDIKNSTFLWELFPNAMRTAIKTHNDIMRRLLRIYGGYEVKTEGDAFMVAFPTPISSLVWCMSIQLKLLSAQWPEEITSIQDGCVVMDKNGNKIYQGLSVRMGVHWGCPVPELDLVTQRMDYLGPMVNKAARVESVADGGQITLSSDFCSEFNKIMKFHEKVVKDKEPLKDVYGEEFVGELIEREIAMLESIGWVFFDHGEQKLKGLETKERITIAYPKSLSSRHNFVTEDEETRMLSEDCLSRLRTVARKLESILSAVSGGYIDVEHRMKGKTFSIDECVKSSISLVTSEVETFAFFDHLVTRVESFAALIRLQQVTSGGLECYRVGDNGPAQRSIMELLDHILKEIGK